MLRKDIQQKLREHGVTPTSQRVEVAEVLFRQPQHLSADQIIDQLSSVNSNVSKATVYNSLNLFSEKDLIREINVDRTRTFYDSTTHPHHHFYHIETGELVDVADDQIDISGLPPLPPGTSKESVEVLIRIRSKEV